MSLFKKILFLTIFFLISSKICIYPFWNKNPNIDKAVELIKEKKYNEAKQILLNELLKDPKNKEKITKLIRQIEDIEKEKSRNLNYGFSSLKEENIENAMIFFEKIDKNSDYDKKLDEIVKLSKLINNTFIQNIYYMDYIYEAEKNLTEFNLKEAYDNIKAALDLFRLTEKDIVNNADFLNFINKFHAAEENLFKLRLDYNFLRKPLSYDKNFFYKQSELINSTYKGWFQIELEFIQLKEDLLLFDQNVKEYIEYKAYFSICEKYIFYIRTAIQKYSRIFIEDALNYIEELTKKRLNAGENLDDRKKTIREIKTNIVEAFEKLAFYKRLINLNDDLFYTRSAKNVIDYFAYLTRKKRVFMSVNFIGFDAAYERAGKSFTEFEKYWNLGDLDTAEKSLISARGETNNLFLFKKESDKDFLNYTFLENNADFKDIYSEKSEIDAKISELGKKIGAAEESLNNEKFAIMKFAKTAEESFEEAKKLYYQKEYDLSLKKFNESKDNYLEVQIKNKSKRIADNIANINEFLDELDTIIYEKDIKEANLRLDAAKSEFYRGNYDEAKKNIDIADSLYRKLNQTNEFIDYYRERIVAAIKINSGTKLKIDDPVYDYVVELFKSAVNYYENKQYKLARDFINLVLIEKPYYEEARRIETKILKETDIDSFNEAYKIYKGRAMEKYKNEKYGEAINEFQLLKEFGVDIAEINGYIKICREKLNFTPTVLSENDKREAIRYVAIAEDLYGRELFEESNVQIDNALRLWSDVPKGSEIKYRILIKLKKPLPKLNQNNEVQFKKAENAYRDGDFETAFSITSEILKSQDLEKVKKLNVLADIKRKQKL
ncbi:MAG TPA: hypothetical protein PK385_08720 [Spirochaetota bacterium]|nr:hypothetical protein [Spirochaetota bacterium]HOS33354.1 hypothetical protein [Spirochaetota bacterium]HOS56126.1 hypothetical protein [Spirochaetota bacterium]HPK62827.1 hypothetical protein [Spirochaetota bacterium]HQF77658.1 hypothetical protein [Spirochaetota bacterium]